MSITTGTDLQIFGKYSNKKLKNNSLHYEKMRGVYLIQNISNNKFYIGSTAHSFYERILKGHRYVAFSKNLKKNITERPLYRAFRKYGLENFKVSALWIFPEEKYKDKTQSKIRTIILEKEQEYLDKYFSHELCYNLSDRADKPSGSKVEGGYIITHPDGTEESYDFLSEWCADNNMPTYAFRSILSGQQLHHQSFTVRYGDSKLNKSTGHFVKDTRKVIFDSEGTKFYVSNLLEFAKEHIPEITPEGAQQGLLKACKNNTLYKGFQVYEHEKAPEEAKVFDTSEKITHIIYSPKGQQRFEVTNLTQFCKDHGLSTADRINFSNCAGKKRHQVKGWTCYYPEDEPAQWVDPRELAGIKKIILYNPTTSELFEIYNEDSDYKKYKLRKNSVYKAANPDYAGNTYKGYYCYFKEDFPGVDYIKNVPENVQWKIETKEDGVPVIGTILECVDWIVKNTSISKPNARRCWARNKGKDKFEYLNLVIQKLH